MIPHSLLQAMRRVRLDHRFEWWCWGVVSALTGAMVVGATVMHDKVQERLTRVNSQIEAASAKMQQSVAVPAPVADFTQSMGLPPSAVRVVQELKQASAAANATLVSTQSQEHPPAVDRLGKLELTVVLKGSYASDKQVLALVVERFPFVSVSHLRLRKGQGPSDVEATATLVFWGAPTAAGDDVRR